MFFFGKRVFKSFKLREGTEGFDPSQDGRILGPRMASLALHLFFECVIFENAFLRTLRLNCPDSGLALLPQVWGFTLPRSNNQNRYRANFKAHLNVFYRAAER